MRNTRFQPIRQNATGFALIEVLVALVILAIGLLGTLGLQLATLRSNQFTTQGAIAAQLARDYEEIVQMVPSSTVSSSEGTSTFSVLDTNSGVSSVKDCKGATTTCTPAELVDYLVNDWKAKVISDLPAGRAVVCRDSAPKDATGSGQGLYHWSCDDQGDMIMIKIGWAARSDKTDKVMQSIAADNRPRIVITVFGNQRDFTD